MWRVRNESTGKEVLYYEAELIDKIKDIIKPVIIMNTCDNCDGVEYGDGCKDISCGTYAVYEVWKLIEKEGK